jgi:ABC-type molybdate transport system substrate-binding protein
MIAMRGCLAGLALLFGFALSASAESLHVAGAGSLTAAFTDLLRGFPAAPDTVAPPEFGPSGLMRQKIEAGAEIDLFASADMEQARRLAVGHPERIVVHFTRNRLCALSRPSVGLTSSNMLDRLLDPRVRLATSTPGADPAGDYAWAVFARAEAVRAGARAALEGKAKQLFGGPATPLLVPGKGAVEGVFLADQADVALGYCSGAPAVSREVPGLDIVPLPTELSVNPAYGMVLLNAKPVTLRFAIFVMSETGQAVLKAHGFDPTAFVEPGEPQRGLLVQRAGAASQIISPERFATLAHITQRFPSGRGEQQDEWTGPLLWDVLSLSGVVRNAGPRELAHLAVRVTGADGYSALVALGEIAPHFAGRQIQLADQENGAPLPNRALRLVVPGDVAGGRWVRDVVRIDVE